MSLLFYKILIDKDEGLEVAGYSIPRVGEIVELSKKIDGKLVMMYGTVQSVLHPIVVGGRLCRGGSASTPILKVKLAGDK